MDHTAKVSNIPYEDLAVYTFDELGKCLESEYKLNVEEIRKRKAGVFMVWEKGQNAKIFYDGEAKELFSVATAFKFEGFVKGQVASRGGVSNFLGKVRVVLDPSKDIFEDGEILVTSMTRIEFVPLMRKAKAIITNEGGIACHAAIISRELGIPCIIGTKIATKVLKDGDLVEVNVNEGVVKIIKRYEED
jgi:phosphohistidine swiveling domain-containing protein